MFVVAEPERGNAATGVKQRATVWISNPIAGATLSGAVTVAAKASPNARLARMGLAVDGVVVSSDSTYPYSWRWQSTTVANGIHSLQVRAYGRNRKSRQLRTAMSAPVSVTVANPLPPPGAAAAPAANPSAPSSSGSTQTPSG